MDIARSSSKANFPFLVQCRNTENWNTHSAFKSLKVACSVASNIKAEYPNLPVRVLHCTGGPMEVQP